MTLARTLASYGVRCLLVERNPSTTRHPKMDITNGRSMELFRQLRPGRSTGCGRSCGEGNNFDVSWITSLARRGGRRELHRFRYPSVVEKRAEIRQKNDGSQPREPAMQVSQVKIEPVLRDAIVDDPLVDARWGVAFEDFQQDEAGVTATLRTMETGATETVRCDFLAWVATAARAPCATSSASASRGAAGRASLHDPFPPEARDLLQAFGIAWHYQTDKGTLIAQDDIDTWTLQTRPPPGVDPAAIDPHGDARCLGRPSIRARHPGRQSVVHAPAAGRALWRRTSLPGG